MTEADASRIERLMIENVELRQRAEQALQGLWGVLMAHSGETLVEASTLELAIHGRVQCWSTEKGFLFKAVGPDEDGH
jgi:hypothetical protein